MWFPVVSALMTLVLTASFCIPAFFALRGQDLEHVNPAVKYPLMFGFYFISYFVVIFFNAGLVTCAHQSLMGGKPTFSDGIANAVKHLPAILGWTVIASTVGMLLQLVSERSGAIGKIIVSLLGAGWNIVTFFVVPVIAVENGSPVAAVKKSTSMLKSTWGENLIGGVGLGFVIGLLMLLPLIPIIAGIAVLISTNSPVLLIIAGIVSVLYWILLATISASLQGIYRTALYVYATTGQTPSVFNESSIREAFAPKPPSKVIGYFRK